MKEQYQPLRERMRDFHNLADFSNAPDSVAVLKQMPQTSANQMSMQAPMQTHMQAPVQTPMQAPMQMERSTCRECFDDFEIAMSYVPVQKWQDIYDPDVALERATLFAQLDKPFLGRRAIND